MLQGRDVKAVSRVWERSSGVCLCKILGTAPWGAVYCMPVTRKEN